MQFSSLTARLIYGALKRQLYSKFISPAQLNSTVEFRRVGVNWLLNSSRNQKTTSDIKRHRSNELEI